MTSVHYKIQRAIHRALAEGQTLTSFFIESGEVDDLAKWCASAVWPPVSQDVSRNAILAGKVRILGVKIAVRGIR